MFVSSYSTYINTSNPDRITKSQTDSKKSEIKSFQSVLTKSTPLHAYNSKNIPIDYISNYKSFNNQQKLQDQVKSKDEVKFKKISDIKNAKVAYTDNSKMFSLLKVPEISLNQTPQINKNLPQNIQDLKENNLRYKMVNTYMSNDRYYQITA
ncbi:MAG: hypothetical protein DRG78_16760 [Epsilonproteobacteria bacterium]|nr:MAG: hypothetical protein DRG78_16760 [Campylobacterota bacterium]